MDESACLVRSFSNPEDVSREVKEGDPAHGQIRALTESISFGRFMSESLAWEKWSTFSHNRYLEEVEKFSKPGSVAQKKAFFEAHYKRRAAMRAAALLEQTNIVTNDASQMDLANSNMPSAANQREKDIFDAEITNTAYVDAGKHNVLRENDVTNVEQGPKVMEEDVNMEVCQQVENLNAFENVEIQDKIMGTPTNTPKKRDEPKNSTSSSKKRRTNSSSKASLPSRASKSPLHPSKRKVPGLTRNDADVVTSTGNSNEKKKTMLSPLHTSINFASSSGKSEKTSLRMSRESATPPQTRTRVLKKAADQKNLASSSEKRQSNSTLKLTNHGGVSKLAMPRIGNESNNHTFINKKPALDSNEQRRITQNSLHMSMNFSTPAGEATKTSPKISRESSNRLRTSSRATVDADSKHASKVIQSRDKRTISVNKYVSAAGDKRWPPISNCSKSSNASGTRAKFISSSQCRMQTRDLQDGLPLILKALRMD
ncbi:Heat shock protein, putative isoform 1 [Hibiscus syriacus]|uniref:Heat shock protein, putative isoform 1 n=1 Tax=Hibiscus syriacus TaxID=106335 RepID=A0A6A2WUB0_HIBSY|nr:Heat shock protein, putative isoform 1 [Hibiscus syriacus]